MIRRALMAATAVGIAVLPLGVMPSAHAIGGNCYISSNNIRQIGNQAAADAWTSCPDSRFVQITILLTPWNGSGSDAEGTTLPLLGCSYSTCDAATFNYASSSSRCYWSNVYAVTEYGQYMYNGTGACF